MCALPSTGQAKGKTGQVEAMFDAIASRYDLLNRVLSLGVDRSWRREAVNILVDESPQRILDVATGTGDLALEALRLAPKQVVGVDISEGMLALARAKAERMGASDRVVFRRGDAQRLPFSDRQFHAALVAFGVRNFEDLDRGLAEIRRVLRPGATLVVLEFSQPTVFPVKQAYALYSRTLLRGIGPLAPRHNGAYSYLPASIAVFPYGNAFLERMKTAGYTDLTCRPLTFGIVSLYTGKVRA